MSNSHVAQWQAEVVLLYSGGKKLLDYFPTMFPQCSEQHFHSSTTTGILFSSFVLLTMFATDAERINSRANLE